MRKHHLFWLIAFMALVACQNQSITTETSSGGFGSSTDEVIQLPTAVNTIAIDQRFLAGLSEPTALISAAPAFDVRWNELVTITGQDLPPGETIFLQAQIEGEDVPFILGQGMAGAGGEMVVQTMVPAGYFGHTLEIYALTADGRLWAETELTFGHRAHVVKIKDDQSGFSLTIPDAWEASEPMVTPMGLMRLFGPRPLISGDPATSMVLLAESSAMTIEGAASLLTCGNIGCLASPAFRPVQIGGLTARSLSIGTEETPTLEWFFLEANDFLIFFTLHDPVTLKTIPLLLDSIEIEVVKTVEEENKVQPTPMIVSSPTLLPTRTASAREADTTATPVPPLISPTSSPAAPTLTPIPGLITTPSQETLTPTIDVFSAGPVQTVSNFILLIIRNEASGEEVEYLSDAGRNAVAGPGDLVGILNLGFNPVEFNLERLFTNDLRVIIEGEFINGSDRAIRHFSMVKESGRWRIDGITAGPTP